MAAGRVWLGGRVCVAAAAHQRAAGYEEVEALLGGWVVATLATLLHFFVGINGWAYAKLFPGRPRCLECDRPLVGWASRLAQTRPASYSPKLCNDCQHAMRSEEGGTEVDLTLLFADVRGSTTLAEQTSTADYKRLIQRFYQAAGRVLIQHNALVNRLMGDQVIGLFVPRFAGTAHSQAAVAAARDLLRATGHADPGGPWVPVGIGIHTRASGHRIQFGREFATR